VDLAHRLDGLRRDRSRRAQDARAMARRWARLAEREVDDSQYDGPAPSPHGGGERRGPSQGKELRGSRREERIGSVSPGVLLALAFPDRIAKSRGAGGAFLLVNGRGANVDQ